MKTALISVFLISLTSTALANQTAPGMSVLSYFSTHDHSLSGPESTAQLKVTPTETLEANIIQIST